jgi:ATP-dependent helicase YprA (DUF1998 family)
MISGTTLYACRGAVGEAERNALDAALRRRRAAHAAHSRAILDLDSTPEERQEARRAVEEAEQAVAAATAALEALL